VLVNGSGDAHGKRLEVSGLTIEVRRSGVWRTAVRGVSFVLEPGDRAALVGESGSGKSLTALSIVGLLPTGARVVDGTVKFDGRDLLTADQETLRRIRGRGIGFVFQNPMSALDPLARVGTQIQEALRAHGQGGRQSRAAHAVELLTRVGVHDASRRVRDFPHQFSGGMRQRVMIAGALAASPSLLIADEPTTALDVTVQAQILSLIRSLTREYHLSVLMITHDLAVARQIADRVIVMYAGRVLEDAPIAAMVERPHHPYTEALLALVPELDGPIQLAPAIPGTPIAGWESGPGCPFAGRCRHAEDGCSATPWALHAVHANHMSACILPPDLRAREAADQ
jgi:oligopeptide/dipeptide ABC transporter ATP-binding protein